MQHDSGNFHLFVTDSHDLSDFNTFNFPRNKPLLQPDINHQLKGIIWLPAIRQHLKITTQHPHNKLFPDAWGSVGGCQFFTIRTAPLCNGFRSFF